MKNILLLPNLGNTCYLNTGIQCLLSSSLFTNYLLNTSFPDHTLQQSLKVFFTNIDDINIRKHYIYFTRFVKHLEQVMINIMNIYEQNDVSELLTLLLDKMNTEIGQELNPYNIPIFTDKSLSVIGRLNHKCITAYEIQFKNEFSQIIPMFYSFLICQIVCGCTKIHHNYEHFNMLQLEIPTSLCNSKVCLEDCINQFMKSYDLNIGDNEWKCDHCNLKIKSTKSFVFWTLPDILIISFKRFVYDSSKHTFCKNNVSVELPDIIDMNKWMLSQRNSVNYELKAIGCHIGSLSYGHYYSVVWNKYKKQWISIDDDRVQSVDFEKILKNVYICVYEKVK